MVIIPLQDLASANGPDVVGVAPPYAGEPGAGDGVAGPGRAVPPQDGVKEFLHAVEINLIKATHAKPGRSD